ncbi:MAG: phosphopantothenoylcysteine decarboxylase [Kiritimatiellales bacterium]|nr:phosphopantothenoylcysteine decarboxylase [Kiritimatiellales bacterium]
MKKVLILSGPTHEYFDPVRFIGNASSGKMGKALAEEALKRGMEINFISGPVPEANLPNIGKKIVHVTSAEEMLAPAKERFAAADIIIFAAAVADFQPLEKSAGKFPKVEKNISIELKPTPDIAATLCASKRKDQIAIGFALQTHDGEAKAREKLISKNLDGIVLNTPATLGAESGLFTWISFQCLDPSKAREALRTQSSDHWERQNWGLLNKADCAQRVLAKATA